MSTIVALSTASGRSALAVIRLSGPHALSIVTQLVQDNSFHPRPNRTSLQVIHDSHTGLIVDQAVITFFRAPQSFTGEDVVEISCHGSPVVVRKILDLGLAHGARLAEPGEFTLRALANGKLDLSQAEAIRDLIDARTIAAANQAIRQLDGELSRTLQPTKERLIEAVVRLESAIEFVEDDLPAVQSKVLVEEISRAKVDLCRLASSFAAGHWLRDGLRAAIVGRPNVGKSSLFNALLQFDRAIVTDIPGTTRDTLSETIDLNGLAVRFTDTAGVREASDSIESIGIDRTNQAMADADVILLVIDGSVPVTGEDLKLWRRLGERRHIVVVNKCDLPSANSIEPEQAFQGADVVRVSALYGEGLEVLSNVIASLVDVGNANIDGVLVTDSRHYDLLCHARDELGNALGSLRANEGEELVLTGLYNALKFLGAITGETTTEEILSEIFATFCIGK